MKIVSFELIGKIENASNGNIDVVAHADDGRSYCVTFFTSTNIASLMDRYKETGECLSGRYFWAADMIIVNELTWHEIARVLNDLAESEMLPRASSEVKTGD
jgi:hypothetical protein